MKKATIKTVITWTCVVSLIVWFAAWLERGVMVDVRVHEVKETTSTATFSVRGYWGLEDVVFINEVGVDVCRIKAAKKQVRKQIREIRRNNHYVEYMDENCPGWNNEEEEDNNEKKARQMCRKSKKGKLVEVVEEPRRTPGQQMPVTYLYEDNTEGWDIHVDWEACDTSIAYIAEPLSVDSTGLYIVYYDRMLSASEIDSIYQEHKKMRSWYPSNEPDSNWTDDLISSDPSDTVWHNYTVVIPIPPEK